MKVAVTIFLTIVFLQSCYGFRLRRSLGPPGGGGIVIEELVMESLIRHRFSNTRVQCSMTNMLPHGQEATFSIQLPNEAFISNFSMVIGGKEEVGVVMRKEVAHETYERDRARGASAGLTSARGSNKFLLRVNIAGNETVYFTLSYQELLRRSLGFYEHMLNIDPGQVVHDLYVKIDIEETKKISKLHVPKLRYNNGTEHTIFDSEHAVWEQPEPHIASVTFNPSIEEQLHMSQTGVAGQFLVKYDVEREQNKGDILIVDGYFVHFVAPEEFEPLPKSVVFVLDISGSMRNSKLQQVKSSMETILDELRESDFFNIITFNSVVSRWRDESLYPANQENIAAAKYFVNQLEAGRSTNINDALMEAMEIMGSTSTLQTTVPLIVFLTDGNPTSGQTDVATIIRNVGLANENSIYLFSLGYGDGVEFSFLKQLSVKTSAFARKIYEDSDASIQLNNFFTDVASPLMMDVKITYRYADEDEDANTESTSTEFPSFFKGRDLVIAGKLNTLESESRPLDIAISGKTSAGSIVEHETALEEFIEEDGPPGLTSVSMERVWAYLSIKELLRNLEKSEEDEESGNLREEAIALALKYSFVTPLTSMVVTQRGKTTEFTDDVDEVGAVRSYSHRAHQGPQVAPSRSQDERQRQTDQRQSDQRRTTTTTTTQGPPVVPRPRVMVYREQLQLPICLSMPEDYGTKEIFHSDDLLVEAQLGQSRYSRGETVIYRLKIKYQQVVIEFRSTSDPLRWRKKPIYSRLPRSLNINRNRRHVKLEFDSGLEIEVSTGTSHRNRRSFRGYYLKMRWNNNPNPRVCGYIGQLGMAGNALCNNLSLLSHSLSAGTALLSGLNNPGSIGFVQKVNSWNSVDKCWHRR